GVGGPVRRAFDPVPGQISQGAVLDAIGTVLPQRPGGQEEVYRRAGDMARGRSALDAAVDGPEAAAGAGGWEPELVTNPPPLLRVGGEAVGAGDLDEARRGVAAGGQGGRCHAVLELFVRGPQQIARAEVAGHRQARARPSREYHIIS